MYTLILSIACAAGAGCDYDEYKVAEFYDRAHGSSMCSGLSSTLMRARTPKDKEREVLFRCLDNDDPRNEGRKVYISDATETTLFIELCPYDERSGRFKKSGSSECKMEDVATFYGEQSSDLCSDRATNTRPVYASDYSTNSYDGHLSCVTGGPESDAL